MIPGGYILQPRLFYKSDAAHLPPCTREVWAYVLSSVNHSDNKQFKRGQGFFKYPDIQNALHWYVGNSRRTYSKPQISKAFGRLSEETMLETRKATRGIVVTILNYEYYQDPRNYAGNAEESPKRVGSACDGDTISKNLRSKNGKKESKTPCADESPRFPVEEHFESFWTHYPKRNGKRVGKGDALAKYKLIVKTEVEANLLFDCVTNYGDECQATDSFPMDAKRWLVAKRWEEYKPGVYEAPESPQPKQTGIDELIHRAEEMEGKHGAVRRIEDS